MPASPWSACCRSPERRRPQARLGAFLALVVCLWAFAAAADELRVSRDGETIIIHGQLDLPVPPRAAWATLTDYAQFVDFVPDVTHSRLLPSGIHERLLDLRGKNRVLFFSAEYRAVLALQEEGEERIRFKAVSGNFKELEGEWHLSPNGAGTRIAYRARLVPDFWVPPLIGPLLIRYNVRRQLEGMVREMERRAVRGRAMPVSPPSGNQ